MNWRHLVHILCLGEFHRDGRFALLSSVLLIVLFHATGIFFFALVH